MVSDALQLRSTDSVLDVGCGTGWFTQRAESMAARVVGLDVDAAALDFARDRGETRIEFLQGDARSLPFPDASFDKVMSVTALCFVRDWQRAVAEIVRVTRKRFAIGLLNRHSVLYLRKGRHAGADGYAGAHWHTRAELVHALRGFPAVECTVSSGIFDASAGAAARVVEHVLPSSWSVGSFLLLSGRPARRGPAGGAWKV